MVHYKSAWRRVIGFVFAVGGGGRVVADNY